MDHLKLCNEIIEATKENDDFNQEFIIKMKESIDKGWTLSEKQEAAIEKIHKCWAKDLSPKIDAKSVKEVQDNMDKEKTDCPW